jgi:hypothetical protein
LIQVQDKIEIHWLYLRSQETGRATMKKNISIIITAIAAFCIGLHPASASLLGMPINPKFAIELRNVDAPAPACEFYTDDVLTDPLLVKGC